MTRPSDPDPSAPDFMARRERRRSELNRLPGVASDRPEERRGWFERVYNEAGGDPAAVPWADLAPHTGLTSWLAGRNGEGRTAIDVGCGLGDNAEALAAAGWKTSAFDLVPSAIAWARQRFPETGVDYRVADLFALPPEWSGAFDLVHECYTLQALRGDMRSRAFGAVAGLVAPGGTLLVIARSRPEGPEPEGPPWPLPPSALRRFEALGFAVVDELTFEVERLDRVIPHVRMAFRRTG